MTFEVGSGTSGSGGGGSSRTEECPFPKKAEPLASDQHFDLSTNHEVHVFSEFVLLIDDVASAQMHRRDRLA